jgi:pimeloyl-ACP methyl ester carboxylesterase
MKFTGDVDIAFEDSGTADLTVVLLHGHPFNRSMWRAQIDFLRPNYRVVAPDLRGYGESVSVGEASAMSAMANDVRQLLDFLRIEKIVLGGLSMGGYVALEFYSLFAERIEALILADTKAAADADDARQKRFETAEKLMREGMQPIVEEMLPKALAPATLQNQPDVVKTAREMMLSTAPASAAAGLRGMAERNDHTALLEKISVPTLIVVGEEDSITPPAEAEKMQRAIKNSRLVRIADAGHLSPMEKPEEFNRALLDFLNDLR